MKNMTDQGCPSALELFEYINSCLPDSQATELKKHIENCAYCSETISNLKIHMMQSEDDKRNMYREYQVPDHIAALAKQPTTKAFQSIRQGLPQEFVFGQIWSTQTADQANSKAQLIEPRIVVVLSDNCTGDAPSETVIVAPISLELEFQSQYDLRIFEEESHLGYEFMIEVWNQTTTLVAQLKYCLNSLSEALNGNLRLLNQVYLGLGGDLNSISNRIGWPILHENDPRAIFQAQEIEECKYLHEPALREIARTESSSVDTSKVVPDIWFTREDGTLFLGELKREEAMAIAAPSRIAKDWFLYAKSEVAGEEIIARFVFHLIQRELRMIFEKLPKTLEYSDLLITGYGRSRTKLFSEIVKAEQGGSFAVAKRTHVMPRDIEELNVTIGVK